MQSLRQLGNGFLLGVVSVILVLGAFALTMAEGRMMSGMLPSPTASKAYPSVFPTLPLLSQTETNAILPVATTPLPQAVQSPTVCPPPPGWLAILAQPLDTVDSIALTYNIPQQQIREANCLTGNELTPGSLVYVPARATSTPLPCGAPAGWVNYVVKPGDTLYQIGLLYRIGVPQLQQANCMGGKTTILVGQALKVPNVPTSTATFTPIQPATITMTPSVTETVSETIAPVTTEPATLTLEPSATETIAVTETETQVILPPTDTLAAPSETPTP